MALARHPSELFIFNESQRNSVYCYRALLYGYCDGWRLASGKHSVQCGVIHKLILSPFVSSFCGPTLFSKTSPDCFSLTSSEFLQARQLGKTGLRNCLLAVGQRADQNRQQKDCLCGVRSEIPPGEIPEQEAKKATAGMVGACGKNSCAPTRPGCGI